jgi:hypothetical protein
VENVRRDHPELLDSGVVEVGGRVGVWVGGWGLGMCRLHPAVTLPLLLLLHLLLLLLIKLRHEHLAAA